MTQEMSNLRDIGEQQQTKDKTDISIDIYGQFGLNETAGRNAASHDFPCFTAFLRSC